MISRSERYRLRSLFCRVDASLCVVRRFVWLYRLEQRYRRAHRGGLSNIILT